MLTQSFTSSSYLADAWIPHISKLWSAATDEKCQAPSSDDYCEWTLTQLKREIAQRKLKIDQKKRNKDSYVKLLLSSDGVQHLASQESNGRSVCHIDSVEIQRIVNPQTTPQEILSLPVTPSTQQLQERLTPQMTQPKHVTPVASPQQFQIQKQSSEPVVSKPHPQPPLPQAVAIVPDEDGFDSPVELVAVEDSRCSILQKRRRLGPDESLWDTEMDKKQHEYLRHELAIKVAKVDIQTRRLELESKRDKQCQELQQVQLELAQEQLKQAKLSTQKIRIEWMIEQTLHKKRLRDAGICEQDISAIV